MTTGRCEIISITDNAPIYLRTTFEKPARGQRLTIVRSVSFRDRYEVPKLLLAIEGCCQACNDGQGHHIVTVADFMKHFSPLTEKGNMSEYISVDEALSLIDDFRSVLGSAPIRCGNYIYMLSMEDVPARRARGIIGRLTVGEPKTKNEIYLPLSDTSSVRRAIMQPLLDAREKLEGEMLEILSLKEEVRSAFIDVKELIKAPK